MMIEKSSNHQSWKCLTLVAAMSFWSAPAIALLEEVIVTAQKRAESVQDVPISIQAFSGDQLEKMRVSKASDVTKLVPNLNISGQNSANRQIAIRGVGTSDFFGNATGSVGIYMDEVTMSAPYLSGLGLYDLERVEVLRGPQNSLFGRNTTGGAINYISRIPQVGEDNEGYASLTFGNYNLIELEAAGSLALGDQAAVRLAAKSFTRDGIWNDLGNNGADFGDKDRKSLRATLVWEPNDETSVIFNFHTAREDSDFDPVRPVGLRIGPGIPAIPGSLPAQLDFATAYDSSNSQGNNPSTSDWNDVYITATNINKVDADGAYVKFTRDFEKATFTSITSFDQTDVLWTFEAGGVGNITPTAVSVINVITGISPMAAPQVTLAIDQDQSYKQFSQEFRLVSSGDGPFRWIAGLYFFSEDSTLSQNIRFGAFSPPPVNGAPPINIGAPLGGSLGLLALANLAAGPNSPPVLASDNLGILVPGAVPVGYGNLMAFSIAELENKVWSPYIHSNFDLSETLTLTVGLRYTNDTKSLPSMLNGNASTLGDPPTTVYTRELVLQRSAGAPACDLDGDGNINIAGNTLDRRGQICTQQLSRPDLNFNEIGGKIGLDWRATDNVLVFGSFSRGFRSGKYDIEFLHGPHTGFITEDLDVETLNAFELGFKSDLLDGAMQLNVSAYFYIWKDQQTFYVNPASGPLFANIPESELKGLEVEWKWAPTDSLLIQAAVGLQDTEITEAGPTDLDDQGHELPFASKKSANLLVIKDFELGDGLLSLQADVSYKSAAKAYARSIGFVDELEAATIVNARLSYVFGGERQFELSLFGENLSEEETCSYKTELFAFSGTAYCVANEAVAFYGLQGKIRF